MAKEGNSKYQHAEAYCLMTYQCEMCGHTERLWNSRDGVTPYIINCDRCDQPSRHIDFQRDLCKPKHVPTKGQRVFIDFPLELKEPLARRRVKRFFERTKGSRWEDDAFEQMVQDVIRSYHPGNPFIVKV